jgi:hypothetical protein
MSPQPAALAQSPYPVDAEAHIWRGWRNISGRLRCGLLVDARGVEQWALRVIDLLQREPAVSIEAIYLLEGAGEERVEHAGRWFQRLERWSSLAAAPLARSELRPPAGIPLISVRTEPQSRSLAGADRERIAERGLDVLIWMDSRPLRAQFQGLAGLGVWSFHAGDPGQPPGQPPYWREALSQNPVSALALQQQVDGGVRNIACCQCATEQGWRFTRNAEAPLALAGPVLIRRLLDAAENASLFSAAASEPAAGPDLLPPPQDRDAARFVARQTVRSLSRRFRARGRDFQWFIAIRSRRDLFRTSRDRFVPDGFQALPAPDGIGQADPFVIRDGNCNWIFFEEIPRAGPGRLACRELLADGGAGDSVVVLERPYHLSYPAVMRDRGALFLMPETHGNDTVELYRATRFPDEWTLENVLCSNVSAVDTTPVLVDGIWYFFTTSGCCGTETFLFWSKRLDGKWNYHPRNPICADVRKARGAGALFYSGGQLIRPAQDCSVSYGYAIVLNRVNRISPTEYEEEPIETIYPDWSKGLLGTHTLNSNDAFEAIDGVRFAR